MHFMATFGRNNDPMVARRGRMYGRRDNDRHCYQRGKNAPQKANDRTTIRHKRGCLLDFGPMSTVWCFISLTKLRRRPARISKWKVLSIAKDYQT